MTERKTEDGGMDRQRLTVDDLLWVVDEIEVDGKVYRHKMLVPKEGRYRQIMDALGYALRQDGADNQSLRMGA
ncbi:hypothetical protein [Acrocarpospora catenulata]|uniref:hypothetical protein n=1 Tax=Acrocarpospora catenulata TaxID=2836182 RepID=UPI001BDAF6D8|nr:hypothetical protein [Acrocarpospora catenulata]